MKLTGNRRFRLHTVKHWFKPDETFLVAQVEYSYTYNPGAFGFIGIPSERKAWRDLTVEDYINYPGWFNVEKFNNEVKDEFIG